MKNYAGVNSGVTELCFLLPLLVKPVYEFLHGQECVNSKIIKVTMNNAKIRKATYPINCTKNVFIMNLNFKKKHIIDIRQTLQMELDKKKYTQEELSS